MKFIIPAKTGSERCENKNWRSFHGDKSLVDVLIEKLLRVADAGDIFLSVNDGTMLSDNPTQRYIPKSLFGIGGLIRPDRLANNDTPMSEVVKWHAENIPGDDDIAWCQCINPLFDEYAGAIAAWERTDTSDTLAVRYKINGYVLDSFGNPLGMGFGPWAKTTQDVPPLYRYPCTFNIVTRETAIRYGYMGTSPLWHNAAGPLIDIKTSEDFAAAQAVYAALSQR